jgi:hypothetical protein
MTKIIGNPFHNELPICISFNKPYGNGGTICTPWQFINQQTAKVTKCVVTGR